MYNSNTDSLGLILDVEVFFSLGHCSGALCNRFFFCLYVSATILFHPQNVSFKMNVLYIITITLCYCVQFNACYQNQFKIHTSVFLTRLDTASGVLQCTHLAPCLCRAIILQDCVKILGHIPTFTSLP